MNNINEEFDEINNMIKDFKLGLTNLQKKVKKLERDINKQNKVNKKNKKIRKPSGFAKPKNLSKELCDFLNIDENSKMSRTEVTKILIKYIKDNGLYKSSDIKIDVRLSKILSGRVTFFSIQKEMNKHYIKN
jgi:chromatin remodeling complex protein RSC6